MQAVASASGVTFRALGVGVEALEVKVFDLSGRPVFQGTAEGRTLAWDAAGVANGVYLYLAKVKVNGVWQVLGFGKVLILR